MTDKWFEGYGGQTAEQLLALEGEYRTDSLIVAFEEAVQQKAAAGPISTEERYVLAVEALEREVNNGGYGQFFLNSSREFVDVIGESLVAIGCPKTAAITRRAIESLNIRDGVTPEKAEAVILQDDEAVRAALEECDAGYYDNDEPIANLLFEWIRKNPARIRIGGAARG